MQKTIRVVAVAAVLSLMSVSAFAQQGGQRGQRGQGGGQFGRTGGPFSLATAPVKALTAVLKLSEDQASKIQAVQAKQRQMLQELRQQAGGGGGAPDPAAQAEMRAKITESNKKAASEIEAILTPDQAATVKAHTRLWTVVSSMGFSIEIADSLKLTDEQLTIMEKAIKDRQTQQQGGRRGGN